MKAVTRARVSVGDRVAVVAPSGPIDAGELAAGLEWLRARYAVEHDPRVLGRRGYLAGDDETRAQELLDALADPAVRAVFVARGGYGALRVLELAGDRIAAALARDPKPLAGFSDVTALHALWARVGVLAVHGPMIAAIGRGAIREEDRASLVACVEGAALAPWSGLEVWRDGAAQGVAVGGNLALLAALAGTPHAAPMDGAVLFLEDVAEKPYRIDRMLTTLRLSGALRGVVAVVLGDFTGCDPAPDGVSARDVLREGLSVLGVPVVAGAPFGHGHAQRAFALGREVMVEHGGVVRFGP